MSGSACTTIFVNNQELKPLNRFFLLTIKI